MESHSVSFANKPNIFLAFHFYLSRNCHFVILSLAVRTEWVIFFEAGTFLFLWWPLPKPHPFSADKCRLVFSHSPGSHWFRELVSQSKVHPLDETMWQSQAGQDVCFHLWVRVNESQPCFVSQRVCLADGSLSVDGEMQAPSGCSSSSTWAHSPCCPAPASVYRRQEPTCREPAVNCKWCCV